MKWQLQILSLLFTSLAARLKMSSNNTILYNKIKVVTRNSDFWIMKGIQTVYIPASLWWLLILSTSTRICGQLLKWLYNFLNILYSTSVIDIKRQSNSVILNDIRNTNIIRKKNQLEIALAYCIFNSENQQTFIDRPICFVPSCLSEFETNCMSDFLQFDENIHRHSRRPY